MCKVSEVWSVYFDSYNVYTVLQDNLQDCRLGSTDQQILKSIHWGLLVDTFMFVRNSDLEIPFSILSK